MTIELDIVPVKTKAEIDAFLALPYKLYASDKSWRAPLRFERKANITPGKNPGLSHISEQKFLAMRHGRCVGRIAAFLNKAHQNQHNDNAGHFGFFDCEDNPETGSLLLQAAENWARQKGAVKLIGPSQWSVNEETGLLVNGFEHPPVVMMSYGRPYYKDYLKQSGFIKAIDMYAFQANLHEGYPRPRQTQMLVNLANKDQRIRFRKVTLKDFKSEVALSMDIFNDAWSENWGFIPFSDDQISHMAKDMKPLIDPDLFLIGYINDEAVAFITMIPDINSAAVGLNGRLFPFGVFRFLYQLKFKGVKQARIPLMGLRRQWHNKRQGIGLIALLCETIFANARDKGYTHCELSWILEDNVSMIRICEQASAQRYKCYRMYEKAL